LPVTATGAGAAGGVAGVTAGAGVVGGGVTVVGVAVGVSWQVQAGCGDVGGGGGGAVVVAVVAVAGESGEVDASAECEANATVKLVTARAMLASPAILARFVIFNAVIRSLLSCGKIWRADSGAQADRSSCHRAVMP
jgi:hypothetical protein